MLSSLLHNVSAVWYSSAAANQKFVYALKFVMLPLAYQRIQIDVSLLFRTAGGMVDLGVKVQQEHKGRLITLFVNKLMI